MNTDRGKSEGKQQISLSEQIKKIFAQVRQIEKKTIELKNKQMIYIDLYFQLEKLENEERERERKKTKNLTRMSIYEINKSQINNN